MRSILYKALLLNTVLLFVFISQLAANNSKPKGKMKILVDKVFSNNPRKMINKSGIQAIKDMGFSVYSPRWRNQDIQALNENIYLCRNTNLSFLPWMRGTLKNKNDNNHKLTWYNGQEMDIYSPCSPQLWEHLEKWVCIYAKLSKQDPCIGVFLDFEIYEKGKVGNAYDISYDEAAVQSFFHSKNIQESINTSKDRIIAIQPYIKEFKEWQKREWRKRALLLRQKVNAINPKFSFYIYPDASTPFLKEIIPILSTKQSPVVICSASSYIHNTFQSPHSAFQSIKDIIMSGYGQYKKRGFPVRYLGGLDPAVRGNSPYICALKAVAISQKCDGYWVFFELGKSKQNLVNDYENYFSMANHDIDKANFKFPNYKTMNSVQRIKIKNNAGKRVFISGEMRNILTKFYSKLNQFESYNMEGASLDGLTQFDLLILQRLSVSKVDKEKVIKALRNYVINGGSILFTYSSIKNMDSAFPEICKGVLKSAHPRQRSDKRIWDKSRKFDKNQPIISKLDKSNFHVHYAYHYPVKPGPAGTIITRNSSGDPVLVAGELGHGKVAFWGGFLGRKTMPTGREKELLLKLSNWLVKKK